METVGKYVFDNNNILGKSYELLCIVFANKEIARRSDPSDTTAPLALLEKKFFESKGTMLLIELAASLRVMDDQMKKLPQDSDERKTYFDRIAVVNQHNFEMFDDIPSLRDACNKIIHSEVFEFHLRDGIEGHETDVAYLHGVGDKSVEWKHFGGHVRLKGKRDKEDWFVLLNIEGFISAIFTLLS